MRFFGMTDVVPGEDDDTIFLIANEHAFEVTHAL